MPSDLCFVIFAKRFASFKLYPSTASLQCPELLSKSKDVWVPHNQVCSKTTTSIEFPDIVLEYPYLYYLGIYLIILISAGGPS